MNAFQKTLKKEEITTIERSIQDVRRQIVEQKQRVMELNDESDVAVKRVDKRREKVRAVFCDVRRMLLYENKLLERLHGVVEKSLNVKDCIGECYRAFLEIEMDMERSEKSIERCKSVMNHESNGIISDSDWNAVNNNINNKNNNKV